MVYAWNSVNKEVIGHNYVLVIISHLLDSKGLYYKLDAFLIFSSKNFNGIPFRQAHSRLRQKYRTVRSFS
jgi:hypothetical protein